MKLLAEKFESDGYLFLKDFFSEHQVHVLKDMTRKLEEHCSKVIQAEDAGFSIPTELVINRESFDHGKIRQGTVFNLKYSTVQINLI